MTSYLRDMLHKTIAAAVHLWWWQPHVDPDKGQKKGDPKPVVLWFYARHIGCDDELIRGKRVCVTIELQDDIPAGIVP